MRLLGKLIALSVLSAEQRDLMFQLMDRHYVNVQRSVFDADLAEKSWVILLLHVETGKLCGFSTQMLVDLAVDGRPIRALFSGDTIIDQRYWGDPALMHVWGQLALSLMEERENRELFWFLISQGYKTYRFLPVFFHTFFPRHDSPTPESMQRIIQSLGQQKFPETFDSSRRVVCASTAQYHLREGVADISEQRLRDPHVQFFLNENPGHSDGDELCCLAPLTPENFTDAAWRVIHPKL